MFKTTILIHALIFIKHTASFSSNTTPPKLKNKCVSQLEPSHLFIGGLGYCGIRIAELFHEKFPSCRISGCVRSNDRKEDVTKQYGEWIDVHVLDLEGDHQLSGLDRNGLMALSKATYVIQTIAPIVSSDNNNHLEDPLLSLHKSTIESSLKLKWVGYLSSTGVYGDHGGEWVNECSELRCMDSKSMARVSAEHAWRRCLAQLNSRLDIFRCGGIYGPDRNLLRLAWKSDADNFKAPSASEPPKYVNRILVDDISSVLLLAASSSTSCDGEIYNLVDDYPAPRDEVLDEAYKLLGLSPRVAAIFDGTNRHTSDILLFGVILKKQ